MQLTPSEAKEFIPKVKALLKEKLEVYQADLEKAHKTRKYFEDSFANLKLAMNPLVSRLGL